MDMEKMKMRSDFRFPRFAKTEKERSFLFMVVVWLFVH